MMEQERKSVAGLDPNTAALLTYLLGWVTGLLFLAQLGIGIINLLLLAPVTLQLIHLFFAYLIWISSVLMSVSAVTGQK